MRIRNTLVFKDFAYEKKAEKKSEDSNGC